jgi:hypothetical protein
VRNTACPPRENRTSPVAFQNKATSLQLLDDGKACGEWVIAFIRALGFQPRHKATRRGGGCLTRHSPYARVRPGALTIWRLQCTTCRAVFTRLPRFALRYRQMPPEGAREAWLATPGGLSLELCAVISHRLPMARYRLVGTRGQPRLVRGLTRRGLPLPTHFLADEAHSHCLPDEGSLPPRVRGRGLWHRGYPKEASAAALTQP